MIKAQVRSLGVRVQGELAAMSGRLSERADLSHTELLEMSSRLCGYQHWHEAVAIHGRQTDEVSSCGAHSSELDLLVAIPVGSHSRVAALRAGGSGLSYNAFAQTHHHTLLGVLSAVAAAYPAALGWTAEAWRSRALDLFRALWPALLEGREAGVLELDATTLKKTASWEGISRLRSEADFKLSQEALAHLRDWAKPWHNSYSGPDNEMRARFEPVQVMWSEVIDWLLGKAEARGPAWGSMRDKASKKILVEADARALALAWALCEAEGACGKKVDVSRLEPREVALAVAWFAPISRQVDHGWRAWGKSSKDRTAMPS